MSGSTITIQEYLANFKSATSWLIENGARVEKGRLVQYKKILNEYADSIRNGTLDELLNSVNVGSIICTIMEAGQLIELHRGFSKADSNLVREKLAQLVGGQTLYSQDSSQKSDARNTAYELFISSFVAKNGFTLKEGSLSDSSFNSRGLSFHIESKYPKSLKKLERALSDAKKQLVERRKGLLVPARFRGIIAINATTIINPEFNFFTYTKNMDPRRYANAYLERLANENCKTIANYLQKPVNAIIMNLHGVFIGNDTPQYVSQFLIQLEKRMDTTTESTLRSVFRD